MTGSTVNEIWEITDTKTIDDINYYKLIKYYLKFNSSDTVYYRYSGDTLFYRPVGYKEYITAEFSLRQNDSTYWDPGAIVTKKTENSITFSAPFGVETGFSVTYVKGVGITLSKYNGFTYYYHKLIKAEIR
jgi:hypothetical protein